MPGLDVRVVNEINWRNAVDNIVVDVRTDFILAPHLDVIFRKNPDALVEQLCGSLRAGTYKQQLPITMSVPKQGILTRPGSILLPHDRLLYQGLVEDLFEKIEAEFDRTVSFSHMPSNVEGTLFKPSFAGWKLFQKKIEEICNASKVILQCDIANFFETLPQHNLINALNGCGGRPESVSFLEKTLSSFRQKSSQGIIQGIYPSDILGNFYLTDIDAELSLKGHSSARYVDDIYIGFPTEIEAQKYLATMIEFLRKDGLNLNPSKTKIVKSSDLLFEQKEVDNLFDSARDEIEDMQNFVDSGGYGFQGDWINSDQIEEARTNETATELLAVRALLDYEFENNVQAEKIERFCLPYLRAANDDYGVTRAFDGLSNRPHLMRLYFSYLNHFAPANKDVQDRIEGLIIDDGFYLDYQRMYHIAGIMTCSNVATSTVAHVMHWLSDRKVGIPTRALAAIFVAKFGTARDRRAVRKMYPEEDPYTRAAILFSGQYSTAAEKRTMKTAWQGHSEVNALIASAL